MDLEKARTIVRAVVAETLEDAGSTLDVNDETQLIGSESAVDSMALVQLCLALEDKAESLGFEFDWTSDNAMSKSKGMYRSVEALSAEFFDQYSQQK